MVIYFCSLCLKYCMCISDDLLIQEDLIEMLPAVEEANSISEELDRKKKFEVLLVSPEARGELKGRTKVSVQKS